MLKTEEIELRGRLGGKRVEGKRGINEMALTIEEEIEIKWEEKSFYPVINNRFIFTEKHCDIQIFDNYFLGVRRIFDDDFQREFVHLFFFSEKFVFVVKKFFGENKNDIFLLFHIRPIYFTEVSGARMENFLEGSGLLLDPLIDSSNHSHYFTISESLFYKRNSLFSSTVSDAFICENSTLLAQKIENELKKIYF